MNTLIKLSLVLLAVVAYMAFTSTPEERAERGRLNDIAMQERAERIEANREAITSREMQIDDDQRAMLQRAITSAGYSCPAAKLAFSRGETPHGPAMMVWCGPADREGVFDEARFLVTVLPDDRMNIRPYEG